MAGSDTLAIELSSTFMKVASDSATVPEHEAPSRAAAGAAACGLAVATECSAAMPASARPR